MQIRSGREAQHDAGLNHAAWPARVANAAQLRARSGGDPDAGWFMARVKMPNPRAHHALVCLLRVSWRLAIGIKTGISVSGCHALLFGFTRLL